jgi:hypothetical protein
MSSKSSMLGVEVMKMNQFRKFMYGRYGFDQLSQALIMTSLIISLAGSIFRISIGIYLSYILIVYAVFRVISKNISKRSQENYKFINIINSLKKKFYNSKHTTTGTKTHKYYKCPQCKQTIRVPRGKGRIRITCPKCKAEFIKKS